jgi:hypothetical protein
VWLPLIVAAGIALYENGGPSHVLSWVSSTQTGHSALEAAFSSHASGIQIEGRGLVEKILSDDNRGSRHQRFIVRTGSGQTILIAHNIDLAPRVSELHEGDEVLFNGEYEWNPKGGVLHWTHHDPSGRHSAGWIKHNGRLVQ